MVVRDSRRQADPAAQEGVLVPQVDHKAVPRVSQAKGRAARVADGAGRRDRADRAVPRADQDRADQAVLRVGQADLRRAVKAASDLRQAASRVVLRAVRAVKAASALRAADLRDSRASVPRAADLRDRMVTQTWNNCANATRRCLS